MHALKIKFSLPILAALAISASACFTASAGALLSGDTAKPSGASQAMTGAALEAQQKAVAAVGPNQTVSPSFISQWFPGAEAADATSIMTEFINGERYDVAFAKAPDGAWIKVVKKQFPYETTDDLASVLTAMSAKKMDPRKLANLGGGEVISVAPRGKTLDISGTKAAAAKSQQTKIEKPASSN